MTNVLVINADMGGLDVIAFTGGIGEHQPGGRAEATGGLAFPGVALDRDRNAEVWADCDISAPGARVTTLGSVAREDAGSPGSAGT